MSSENEEKVEERGGLPLSSERPRMPERRTLVSVFLTCSLRCR